MLFKRTLLAVAAFAFVGVASAATTTPVTFKVLLKVTAKCTVQTAAIADIDLGSVAAGDAVTAGSTSISVNCSKGTAYKVGLTPLNLDTAGAGVMKGPGAGTETIPYQLHQTTAAGAVWGNLPANSMGSTGTGMGSAKAQSYTAFATVATSATEDVTVGAYEDTVSVVVTY